MLKGHKLLGFVMVTAIVFAAIPAQAAAKRYQLKSGIVEYEYTGANVSGTETLYFENYGEKEARYSQQKISFMGVKQNVENVSYVDGQWAYSYDPKTKEASRINYEKMMQSMMGEKRAVDYSDEMLEAMGAAKVGTEKLLGKNCNIYEMKDFGTRVWVWKGVALKTKMDFMNMQSTVIAKSFKENAKIDSAKVTLPSDAKIVDAPQAAQVEDVDMQKVREAMGMMNEMQKETVSSPEYQEYLEMKKAEQKKIDEYEGRSVPEATIDGMAKEAQHATQDSLNDATRKGVKKAFGQAFKSLF